MADRIIRDEIWGSDRFLGLPDNAYRLVYLCLLNHCDCAGNFETHARRHFRLWFDATGGYIDSLDAVEKALGVLAEADLIRLYTVDGKRYGHIPRTKWHGRYLKRRHPAPPASVLTNNQGLAKNSQCANNVRTLRAHSAHAVCTAGVGVVVVDGVGVGVGVVGAKEPDAAIVDLTEGESEQNPIKIVGNSTPMLPMDGESPEAFLKRATEALAAKKTV